MRKLFLGLFSTVALLCGVGSAAAQAHTVTFTWTWPTTRVGGAALPLSSIGSFVIFDTSVPAPGAPGTIVPCTVTIPPTTATGTCTTGTLAAGTHAYVAIVSDNATPPDPSAVSNSVSAVIPLSGPAAITNLTATVN
jgi:hypothetical protein